MDFDVSVDMSLSMVIRDARDEKHALEIAKALVSRVEASNEEISGSFYGQDLVTSFSLVDLNEEPIIEILED